MELILCPLAVLFALISFFRGKTVWTILSFFSYALSMLLSLFDINRRIATGDISGVMDIYPTLASVYFAVLVFVTLMNVLAMTKKK